MNENQLLSILTAILVANDPLERAPLALNRAKEIVALVQKHQTETYHG